MPRQFRGLAGGSRFPAAYWTQPYRLVPFPGFGKGLNLRDKPDSIGPDAAFDCLNVDFSQRGAIRQRDGYSKFTFAALTNRVDSLAPFYKTDGTKQLVAGCGTQLEAMDSTGVVVQSYAPGLTSDTWHFARYGAPNSEAMYAGNGHNLVRKWDGANWTSPPGTVNGVLSGGGTGMPRAGAFAVWATSNRLVAGGFATTTGGPEAATSSPSHVYFSEPGDPESWMTVSSPGASPPTYDNHITLSPGDGEKITAIVAFENQVLVFKESKFFTFYGESTDASGGPIFNYRTVDTGIGCATDRAVCVGHDGVYFLGRAGVYKTTGGPPTLVSGVMDPLFVGGLSSLYTTTDGELNHGAINTSAMCWHEERVYLSIPTGASLGNDTVLVYDPRGPWWSLYFFPDGASSLASFRVGNQAHLVFGYAINANDIGAVNPGLTTDDGVAMSSYWKSGWHDFGGDINDIREWKLFGSGTLDFGYAKDFQSATQPKTTVAFPGGAVFTQKQVRNAIRGTTFSLQVASNSGAAWTLDKATAHVREAETASKVEA